LNELAARVQQAKVTMISPRSLLPILGLLALTLRESPAGADAPAGRYVVTTGAGATVTDTATGLIWSRTEVTGTFTFLAALTACSSPWRLPNVVELQTIVDETRTSGPIIDTTAFWGATPSSTPSSSFFWSSTVVAGQGGSYAWYVEFAGGEVAGHAVANTYAVRCVR
jgi:hypothetical protein